MTRHRNVLNYDDDDVGYDDDEYYEEEDDENSEYMYQRGGKPAAPANAGAKQPAAAKSTSGGASAAAATTAADDSDSIVLEECIREIQKITNAFTREDMIESIRRCDYDVQDAVDDLYATKQEADFEENEDFYPYDISLQSKASQKQKKQQKKKDDDEGDSNSADDGRSNKEEVAKSATSTTQQQAPRGGGFMAAFGRGRGITDNSTAQQQPSLSAFGRGTFTAARGGSSFAAGRGSSVTAAPAPGMRGGFAAARGRGASAFGRGAAAAAAPPYHHESDDEEDESSSEEDEIEKQPEQPNQEVTPAVASAPSPQQQEPRPPRQLLPSVATDFSSDVVDKFVKQPSPFGRSLWRKAKQQPTDTRFSFDSRFLRRMQSRPETVVPTMDNLLREMHMSSGDLFYSFADPSPDEVATAQRATAGKIQRQPDKPTAGTPASAASSASSAHKKSFKPEIKKPESIKVDTSKSNTVLTIEDPSGAVRLPTSATGAPPSPSTVFSSSNQASSTTAGTVSTAKSSLSISTKGPTRTPVTPHTAKSASSSKSEGRLTRKDKEALKAAIAAKRAAVPKDEDKERLNVVILGHVDAGKSTLVGHLLVQSGQVSEKLINKFKKESQEIGKASFAYAWVMDEDQEERERGVTVNVGVRFFETPSKIVTILDAPGHKDFIPNMITGAAQGDVAILVVDAQPNQFESGFQNGGQTKEHLLLAKSLGIGEVLVVVNKLDMTDWSKSRFDDIVSQLSAFLKQIGYKDSDISFVPCSGLQGENLMVRSKDPRLVSWYKGPSVVEQIDKFKPVQRALDKALRMTVSDCFKAGHAIAGSVAVAGKIETGHVSVNDQIIIMPIKETAQVKSIIRSGKQIKTAYAGDNVEIGLANIDASKVVIGQIVCDELDRVRLVYRFKARLITFDPEIPILRGTQCMLHLSNQEIDCTVTKLVAQLGKTQEIVKKHPRALLKNSQADVEISVDQPVCIEKFTDYKAYGRFTLRQTGQTIAAGIVTKLKKRKTRQAKLREEPGETTPVSATTAAGSAADASQPPPSPFAPPPSMFSGGNFDDDEFI